MPATVPAVDAPLHRVQVCGDCYISGSMTPAGLRERKKQRTREAIVRKAMALFRRRGYEATTIADIAAAADIAPRTFFAYFATKEAVVSHDFDPLRSEERRAGNEGRSRWS